MTQNLEIILGATVGLAHAYFWSDRRFVYQIIDCETGTKPSIVLRVGNPYKSGPPFNYKTATLVPEEHGFESNEQLVQAVRDYFQETHPNILEIAEN